MSQPPAHPFQDPPVPQAGYREETSPGQTARPHEPEPRPKITGLDVNGAASRPPTGHHDPHEPDPDPKPTGLDLHAED
ncbi:hypothetical protein SCOR_07110 [Sulfidibacter corallicola]|uniref:Uncharacterized protein n=1 Tax=Sulfidibacter corallicola TaxID=2818388 RepID=A0A8A4TY59_SULCO|nr:hypothetical protein [Sulfidibacter corallicola]QTD51465.1 hypothetical protein J3U87_03260 [Sulfidibacter corallicola]